MKGILPSNCDLTSNIGSSFPPVLSDTQAARSPCSCLGWGDHNIILENRVMWQNMLGPGCHMANPCLYWDWHTLMANKTCSVRFLTQTQYHPIPSHNSIPYYIYICIQLLYIYVYIYICVWLPSACHLLPSSNRCPATFGTPCWQKSCQRLVQDEVRFLNLSCCLKSRDILEWVVLGIDWQKINVNF